MCGKLAGRKAALDQSPADAVLLALLVDLDQCDTRFRIHNNIPEELAGAGHQEEFSCKARDTRADIMPFAVIEETIADGIHFMLRQAIGQIAAVALMPSLLVAFVGHLDKCLYKSSFQYSHFVTPPFLMLYCCA